MFEKSASPYKSDDEVVNTPHPADAGGVQKDPPSAEGGARKPPPYPDRDWLKMEEKYAMNFFSGFEKQAKMSGEDFLKGLLDVNEFTGPQYSRAAGGLARKALIGGAVSAGAVALNKLQKDRERLKRHSAKARQSE